mgnify:FL=1
MSDLPCAGSGPAPRNRPGLPHIRYRDRSWADYRQAMLDGLPRDREPLAGLNR